jgi:hypothetical protein
VIHSRRQLQGSENHEKRAERDGFTTLAGRRRVFAESDLKRKLNQQEVNRFRDSARSGG